ncbi:glycosyltransferase family 87 protein [Erythrobacter sp.]|uniref:glycosyltransferase family 87 protein n=1 Tax=Erythrobacter sp. TaxID=1042 RepID=UPI003120459A
MEELRYAGQLDTKSVRGYAWLFAVINVGTLAYLLISSSDNIDAFGQIIGSDFLSFWAAGKLSTSGQSPYDAGAHLAVMQTFAPTLGGYPAYFYPPMFLIACYPLGFLSYFAALGLWLVTTGTVFVATARMWARHLDLKLPIWLWLAAFPPVLITITHGQTSFLLAALLGSGLLLVRDRPWIAGLLLGLATFKPQFGLLIPIAILLTGNWRVAVVAVGTVALQTLFATLAFGPGIWVDWYELTADAQESMAGGSIGYGKMVSVFAASKLVGASDVFAYVIQLIVAGTVSLAVVSVSWRRDWSHALAALVLTGAALVTPFALDYDMVILALPLLYLAGTGYRDWEKAISAFAFLATLLARPLALQFGVPTIPLALVGLFWVLWRRLALPQET